MRLRTYQAYSMKEAMAALARDLGSDAVILNTRTFKRGGLLGFGARTVHELTATTAREATAASAEKAAAAKREAAARLRAARRADDAADGGAATTRSAAAANARRAYANGHAPVPDRTKPADLEAERAKTRALARRLLAEHEERAGSDAAPGPPAAPSSSAPRRSEAAPADPRVDDAHVRIDAPAVPSPVVPVASPARPAARPARTTPVAEAAPNGSSAPVARRFILRAAHDGSTHAAAPVAPGTAAPALDAALAAGVPTVPADATTVEGRTPPAGPVPAASPSPDARADAPPPAAAPAAAPALDLTPLQDELGAIRAVVGQVLREQARGNAAAAAPTLPEPLFDWYLRLVGQEMSEELAEQVTAHVRGGLDAAALDDPERVREAILDSIAGLVPVADEPLPKRSPDGRPLTITLVGPTGVGKTTTLAKLAAAFHLREGRSVGLVTADTYRIAAVEQLRTYAGIIGLDLHVARTPTEMRQAVTALADRDVILVDTAGRSQRDVDRIAELSAVVRAADPHEVHLVLSGTAGMKLLEREAEAFMPLGVDKIVLTKLDEAVSFGMLVEAVSRIGTRLSFVTTGQDVPDHIERAGGHRLAELLADGCLAGADDAACAPDERATATSADDAAATPGSVGG